MKHGATDVRCQVYTMCIIEECDRDLFWSRDCHCHCDEIAISFAVNPPTLTSCPYIHPSIHPSTHPSIKLSAHQSVLHPSVVFSCMCPVPNSCLFQPYVLLLLRLLLNCAVTCTNQTTHSPILGVVSTSATLVVPASSHTMPPGYVSSVLPMAMLMVSYVCSIASRRGNLTAPFIPINKSIRPPTRLSVYPS